VQSLARHGVAHLLERGMRSLDLSLDPSEIGYRRYLGVLRHHKFCSPGHPPYGMTRAGHLPPCWDFGYHRGLMPQLYLHSLARLGAAARIKELTAEIASLKKVIRHLSLGSAVSPTMPDAMEERKVRRRRREMSAAARAKISAAQKARWAKQKAKK
jgi:hypothetical protein